MIKFLACVFEFYGARTCEHITKYSRSKGIKLNFNLAELDGIELDSENTHMHYIHSCHPNQSFKVKIQIQT